MHNITLIGMPGSGKTTFGKTLAAGLSYHFIDTDDVIIQTYHKPLMELIDEYGTEGFITLEGKVLQSIYTNQAVISTGGSVLDTVAALREAGAEVLGVVSIFTYGMKKGVERMAEAKVKSVSLTNLDTIARVGAEEHYITEADVARLLAFRDDPADESWITKGGTN